jgi:hypothetical protein
MLLGSLVLGSALLWKLYQLSRAPRDLPLRAVIGCLACMTLGHHLGLSAAVAWLNAELFPGAGKLIQNLFVLGSAYALMGFFLLSAAEHGLARVRREAVPLVAVAAVLVLATLSIPEEVRNQALGRQDTRHTWVAVFFFVAGVYLIYALSTAALWARRYAHTADKRLARGLRLTSTGLAVAVLGAVGRAVFTLVRWFGGAVPRSLAALAALLVAIGALVFLVGVSYPGVATRFAASRLWWRHLVTYHKLGPLWTSLHEAYPQDALSRVPVGRFDVLSLLAVHRRYYRRAVECRDGLVRISPYLAQVQAQEPGDDASFPEVLARQLKTALQAQAEGLPVGTSAVAIALPAHNDLDDDVHQLVVLSQELGKS